ncbi:ankyrin repeat domain-containing protein [Bordetella sp. 15P40C-2]|uniref:ankyrin repeat domain-containing protein n=1 Tax=Bordetella sp. 15P40C-2 TaxID=2572246 RepID=UPI001326C488|nr:ankyrin repeat domain-containing protein [Bordetella sp. 15P40C-2]MVW69939.1 hypothetical protein [Bordetella sp. 15P40C-2]
MIPRRFVKKPANFRPALKDQQASPPNNLTTQKAQENQAADLIAKGATEQFQRFATGTLSSIPALRFDHKENCLHKAIAGGHMAIARFLLDPNNGWATSLVNHRDIHGRTPLRYAVEAPSRISVDLIDNLLSAGAKDDLSEMLAHCVMQASHERISERLIAADAKPSYAMARLYNLPMQSRAHVHEAVTFLGSRGIDNALMFQYAIAQRMHRAVELMALVGHNWSEQLMLAAERLDSSTVQFLLQSGVDYASVLTKLITNQPGWYGPDSARTYALASLSKGREDSKLPPRWEREALFWFDQRGMSTAVRKLRQWNPSTPLSLRDIAQCSVHTIKELQKLGVVPEHALETVVHHGNLALAQKLVAAGVPTAALLERLQNDSDPARRLSNAKAVRLLVLAGADANLLDDDQRQGFRKLIQRVSQSSGDDIVRRMINAANESAADELSMLIHDPKNTDMAVRALKTLVDLERPRVAAMLITCGLDAAEALIATVSVAEPNWWQAKGLIQASEAIRYPDESEADLLTDDPERHSLQNQVLFALTLRDQWDLAAKFIPNLTCGSWALLESALRHDAERAKRLHEIGADICRAFFIALQTKRYEAAARLMSWMPYKVYDAQLRAYKALTEPYVRALAQDCLMLRGANITATLLLTAHLGLEEATRRLLSQHPEAGKNALMELSGNPPRDDVSAKLQFLLKAGLDPYPVVFELATNPFNATNLTRLNNLAALGLTAARDALQGNILKP